jgi:hypothetical protein
VHLRAEALALTTAVLLGSCNSTELVKLAPAGAILAAVAGDGDTVAAGGVVMLTVSLRDSSGLPVDQVAVGWTVTQGSGSLPAASKTGADGMASAAFTVGTTTGTKQVTAIVYGAAGSPLVLTVTVIHGPATRLVRSGGDGQTAVVGQRLPNKLAVTVVDAYGNGVPGRDVTWSVTAGSATVVPDAPTTDAGGVARAVVTTQPPLGPISVRATSSGLTGSPVTFSATSTVALVLVKELPIAANYGLHDQYLRDGLAFLCAWNTGLLIYDVGNGIAGGSPANPVLVGSIITSDDGVAGGAQVHNAWWYHAPNGEKRYVFIGQEGGGVIGTSSSGDIHVVDVSDLAHPVEVAFYHLAGAGTHNFWVDEVSQILYAAYYNGGVVALDIAGTLSGDLATREISRLQPGGAGNTFTWGVMLYNGSVYATDMLSGFWQLHSNAGTLSVAGGGNNVPNRFGSDQWVANGYAYSGTWGTRFSSTGTGRGNALNVWQLNAAGAPVLVDSIITPSINTVSDVEVSGDGKLLMLSAENGPNAGIWFYDLTASRSHPTLMGQYLVASGVHTTTFAEIGGRRYVFAAKDPPGPSLLVLDVTDLGP